MLSHETRCLQSQLMRAARYARANPGDADAAQRVEQLRERFNIERTADLVAGQLAKLGASRAARERVAAAILST